MLGNLLFKSTVSVRLTPAGAQCHSLSLGMVFFSSWLYHILLPHSSVHGHLRCCHFGFVCLFVFALLNSTRLSTSPHLEPMWKLLWYTHWPASGLTASWSHAVNRGARERVFWAFWQLAHCLSAGKKSNLTLSMRRLLHQSTRTSSQTSLLNHLQKSRHFPIPSRVKNTKKRGQICSPPCRCHRRVKEECTISRWWGRKFPSNNPLLSNNV